MNMDKKGEACNCVPSPFGDSLMKKPDGYYCPQCGLKRELPHDGLAMEVKPTEITCPECYHTWIAGIIQKAEPQCKHVSGGLGACPKCGTRYDDISAEVEAELQGEGEDYEKAEPTAVGLGQALRLFDIGYMTGETVVYLYKDSDEIVRYYEKLAQAVIEFLRSKADGLKYEPSEIKGHGSELDGACGYNNGIDDLIRAGSE